MDKIRKMEIDFGYTIVLTLLATTWLVFSSPQIPLGLLAAYAIKKYKIAKVPNTLLILAAVSGFFGQGFYIKIYDGKLSGGFSFSIQGQPAPVTTNWGEQADEEDFLDVMFKVTSSHGPDGSGEFPIELAGEEGTIWTYEIWLTTFDDAVLFEAFCTLYDIEEETMLGKVSVQVEGDATRKGNRFTIWDSKTESEPLGSKTCEFELNPLQFVIQKQAGQLRAYSNENSYFALKPLED